MPVKIGYARVFRGEPNLNLQLDALKSCDEIFQEITFRPSKDREVLDRAIARLGEGDSFVIWKLDRLCGNLAQVIQCIQEIRERGANLISLVDQLDSATEQGQAFLRATAIYAEIQEYWKRQSTRAGLEEARARGRSGGRALSINKTTIDSARDLRKAGYEVLEICALLHISKASYYRYCLAPRT
jgi:DNA invertase Pin-like site-specific DNA recombinase